MKFSPLTIFSLLILLLNGDVLRAGPNTNVMPGMTYYMGAENLGGKLVFLVQHDYTVETNSEAAASIYEFNLSQRQLKKVADCPNGQFVPSFEDGTFCVIYPFGKWGIGKDTNVFVYSEILGLSRLTNVESSPQDTVVAGGHIFFKLQGYNFPNPGYYLTKSNNPTETKLLDYDAAGNQMKIADFSDVRWQNQQSARFTYQSFDGHYIFFEGKNAPIEGTALVSSSWNFRDANDKDPKGENTKILHRFSALSMFAGIYELLQLSPDRHYALIRLIKPITNKKFSEWPGSTKTYYLVDVLTGKTSVLLEDDSEAVTSGSISKVWWVQ